MWHKIKCFGCKIYHLPNVCSNRRYSFIHTFPLSRNKRNFKEVIQTALYVPMKRKPAMATVFKLTAILCISFPTIALWRENITVLLISQYLFPLLFRFQWHRVSFAFKRESIYSLSHRHWFSLAISIVICIDLLTQLSLL